ncbi:MAG: hypothetical protein K6D91_02275 [Prevotella sp.]|nr:hypothetical protein [Prevotella sp.]
MKLRLKRVFNGGFKSHHLYEGPYYGGKASYSYYVDNDNMRVFDGPFHLRLSTLNRYAKEVQSMARGSFIDGLKNGSWCYFYKSDRRRMKLNVEYVKGLIDGKLHFETFDSDNIKNVPKRTSLTFFVHHRRLVGEINGFLHGFRFHGLLDEDGRPHNLWSCNVFDEFNGEWRVVEEWYHGRQVKAERQMVTYGRNERVDSNMYHQLNELIDDINNVMLPIMQHGSLGGLANIPAV